jgi:hypothetical protein
MKTSARHCREPFLALIPFVYGISFFLPAIDGSLGVSTFILGILGCILVSLSIFEGTSPSALSWLPFAWLANPLLWIAYAKLISGKPTKGGTPGCLALILAIAFGVYCGVSYPSDRIGKGLGPGYWLWLSGMVLMVIAAYTCKEECPPLRLPSDESLREACRHLEPTDYTPGSADSRVRPARKH